MKIAIIGKIFAPINVTSNMGMETFTYNLARLLAKRGHDVTLFASGDSRVEGVNVVPIIYKSYYSFSQKLSEENKNIVKGYSHGCVEGQCYVKSLFYLRSHQNEFDIIHDNTDDLSVLGLVPLLVDLPVVSTIHLPPKFLVSLNKFLQGEKSPNYYVAISNKQKKMVKQAKVFSVVYNGVNVRKYHYSDKSRGYLAWIGRLDPNKGLGMAINVALKTKHKLRIAGPIQDQKYFDEQIKPRLNKDIRYLGPLTGRKIVNLYRGAKALIFPIRWEEPFGLVMAEAMACGTPVVAFRRGAVPEVVVQGKTGIICPKDNKLAMIKAVQKIYAMSDNRYLKMRQACRKHVEENFSLEKMVENYEKTYHAAIDDWQKKRSGKVKKLKVLELTSEFTPLAKAGGLADVAGSLPGILAEEYNIDYCVMMPKYAIIDEKKFPQTLFKKDLEIGITKDIKYRVNIYKTSVSGSNVPIYLVDIPGLFPKNQIYPDVQPEENENYPFFVFSKIAVKLLKILDWQPDLIHCHDGMTGLVPKFLEKYRRDPFYRNIATLLTLHNIMYQPVVSEKELDKLGLSVNNFHNKSTINKAELDKMISAKDNLHSRTFTENHKINLMAEAIASFDMLNTVSPTYADEIMTHDYGFGMNKLLRQNKAKFWGILNGISYRNFDPRTNEDTTAKYWIDSLEKKVENKLYLQKKLGLTQSPDLPLICVVSRLTVQKGLELVDEVLKDLMDMGAQFVILGTGEDQIQRMFIKAEKEHPKEIAAEMVFDANFAQTIYAGADILLMPSRFEPCGLSQIIAMRFGTIPIVRKTGGLADTVKDGQTGFVFRDYDKNAFLWAIRRAVDMYYNQKDNWKKMQINGMQKDFSWKTSAKKYLRIYKRALKNHQDNLIKEEEKYDAE